ncbi:paraquat-inducible protein A [Psychromonas antarctica]|jgi:paraquat-inducible protein A|uniref:paraquat-inducible protein A n=1 Tax=Psychromonas antarctica TaxID=67573 RepID=UPI001EE882A3|nr:paraquat-inducible protein A [Psychromonas antarctica]MCG6200443.1 paraquat-inducible protein A [Psychromonas antarctica]
MNKNVVVGKTGLSQGLQLCKVCSHYSEQITDPTHCPTCLNKISLRKKNSLQKTWALLITAIIFIIPANLYPITYLLKNSTLYPDTIFSGILSLVDSGMPGIALIVFVASIVVPLLKIIALAVIAFSVQNEWNLDPKKQLIAFYLIDWIGKWSVLDLFVISIMVAVFDKGHLLSIYPGLAATSFTLVVIATLSAANSFDTRLIWDAQTDE